MSSKFLIASATLLSALSAQAAVSVSSVAFTYSQSFDSLATAGSTAWVNDSTLSGWSLFRTTGTSLTVAAGTGSANAGGFYSYGAAAASDRALGSVASGSTGAINYALALTNDSGSALNSFTLRFDGEQWRNGGATSPAVSVAQTLKLEYGFGATLAGVTTWSAPGGSFDFTSPVIGTSASASGMGNGAGLAAGLGGTVATSWAQGSTLWLRWTDIDNTGSDHGMGIDNLSLSVTAAVPEPSTYAMLLAGLGAVGFIARRRRRG